MEIKVLFVTSRSAVIEIADGGIYHTRMPYDLYVNKRFAMRTGQVITNLFDLLPQTEYMLEIFPCAPSGDREEKAGRSEKDSPAVSRITDCIASAVFTTAEECVTLDVKQMGAAGDGVSDDTVCLQAAVMACPKNGRVLIPKGVYRFRNLFLKSDVQICLEKGAVLAAFTDPDKVPVLPGMLQTWDEKSEYNLGTWEGNPLPMKAGLITAINAQRIVLYGEGVIDGCASEENWWRKDRRKTLPARPRLLFLNHCSQVTVQGLSLRNSPCWTVHPYFSDFISLYGTQIENPEISPNTDGIDPESCTHVMISGVRISTGDDCIAVKAGKIYMAKTYGIPSRDITVRQCLLENGHGAVTIGSEMAGGVYDLKVQECLMSHTDRGLRIKTRRGRGERAVIDGIHFSDVKMDHVMTPIVVNCFYFCDPDGHTAYVQDRSALPVDERTPYIGSMVFEEIDCTNCHVRAMYAEGLPEQKIKELALHRVRFSFAEKNSRKSGVPAMAESVEECSGLGIFASNIHLLTLDQVSVEGQEGPALETGEIDEIR